MKARLLPTTIFYILFLFQTSLYAAVGGDLSYRCLGGNTYELVLNMYENCLHATPPNVQNVVWSSAVCGITGNTISLNLNTANNFPKDVKLTCDADPTLCNSGTQWGVFHYQYVSAPFTMPSCPDVNFYWEECCRLNGANNLVFTTQNMFLRARLNSTLCNSAPKFEYHPLFSACPGALTKYNLGGVDADGDSLAYSLVSCLNGPGSSVAYTMPYSATNPLPTAGGITLDGKSGEISFEATNATGGFESYFVCIEIKEYRGGTQIGSTMQDFRVVIDPQNCAGGTSVPTVSGINNVAGTYVENVCVNDPITFEIFGRDVDGDSVFLVYNNNIPGASMPFFYNAPNDVQGNFSWTPTAADAGKTYYFTVGIRDNQCPRLGKAVYTYRLNVIGGGNDPVNAGSDLSICAGSTTTLTATTATTGTTFSWSPVSALTNPLAASTSASPSTTTTYIVTATHPDGCTTADDIKVGVAPNSLSTSALQTNVACRGDNTGSITANVTGGTGPYTYTWDAAAGGANTATVNNLAVGIYCYTVTDGTGCLATQCVTITEPSTSVSAAISLSSTYSGAMISCNGACDARLSATATGGVAATGYSYQWNTSFLGATTQNITGLCAGTYEVTVTDALGCPATANFTVVEPTPVSATVATAVDPSCFGLCNGTATVTATGGTIVSASVPYQYRWDAAAANQMTATATGLCGSAPATNYSVTVQDNNGCPAVINVPMGTPPAMTVTPTSFLNYNGQDISCNGSADGAITTTVSGGAMPYTYTWSPNAGVQNSDTIISLSAGLYTVTVTEGGGCTATGSVSLSEPSPVTATISSLTTIACNGTATGTATVAGSGGTAGYTYSWSNGANTAMATGLIAGTYIGTVEDVNGCEASTTVNITQAPPIPKPNIRALDATVCEGDNIVLSTTTTAAVYDWSGPNGFTSNIANPPAITGATNIHQGTYTLRVGDGTGCFSLDTTIAITVNALPSPAPYIFGGGNICSYDAFTLEEINGAGCDSFSWIGPVTPQLGLFNTVTVNPGDPNHVSGVWTLHCVDNTTGCLAVSNSVFVNIIPPVPAPTPVLLNSPLCIGDTAELEVPVLPAANIFWYSDPTRFNVLGGMPNIDIAGITTDTNFYVDYRVGGCYSPLATINIQPVPTPATPDISPNIIVCEGDPINLSTNSTEPIIEWIYPSGVTASTNTITINPSTVADGGIYTLAVTNAGGCTSKDTTVLVTVNAAPLPPSVVTSNSPLCHYDTLRLNAGGPCAITEWTSPSGTILLGANIVIAPDSSAFEAGDWQMVCIDAAGCRSIPTIVPVVIRTQITPVAYNNGPVCYGDSVLLGVPLFAGANYIWLASDSVTIIGNNPLEFVTNLTQDSIFFIQLNVNGCNYFDSTLVQVYPLTPAPPVPADTTICEGEPLSLTTATAVGYQWQHPLGMTQNVQTVNISAINLTDAGTYQLTILDANNCPSNISTFNIAVNPTPTAPTISSNSPICSGEDLVLVASTGCDSIEWIGGGGPFVGTDTLIIPAGNANYGNGLTWQARCLDASTGCFSSISANHTVVINTNPTPPTITAVSTMVCEGESVSLSTPLVTNASYTWYNIDTTVILGTSQLLNYPNASPADTTFVLMLTVNGCAAYSNIDITILPRPALPNLSDTTFVCAGDTLFLNTATVAASYTWSGPNSFFSSIQSPFIYPTNIGGIAGQYSLTIKDANNCSSLTNTMEVVVNNPPTSPTITVLPSTSICYGDTLWLISDQNCGQLDWTGPGGTTFSGTDTLVIDSFNINYIDGNWQVLCIDTSTNCQAISNTVTTTIKPLPATPTLSQSGPVCPGDPVTLSMATVSGAIYQWFAPDSTFLGATPTITVPNIASDTLFYGVLIENGCSNFDSIAVLNHLVNKPDIAVADDSVCENSFIQFTTTTSATTYNWSGPNGFAATTQNPFILPITIANTGTYSLNVVDANGCQTADTTVNVVVNPTPTIPTITGTNAICTGDTIVLVAPNCGELSWFFISAVPASPLPPIPVRGTDTLVITSTGPFSAYYQAGFWQVNCTDTITLCQSQVSASFDVNIFSYPATPVVTNTGLICQYDSVLLSVNAQPASSYLWSSSSSFSDTLGMGTSVWIDSVAATTTYYVQVLNAGNCSVIDSTTVNVSIAPNAIMINISDSSVCVGEDVIISAIGSPSHIYLWTGPNGFVSSAQTFTLSSVVAGQAGAYTVQVSTGAGCPSTPATVNLQVNVPPPVPTITGGGAVCDGFPIVLTANPSCDSTTWIGTSISFSNTGNQLTLPHLSAGYYDTEWQVVCHDTITGCSITSGKVAIAHFASPPQPIINNPAYVCNGDSALLTTIVIVGATNTWYANGSVIGTGDSITITNITSSTTITLEQSVNGCVAPTATSVIQVHAIPPPPMVNPNINVCLGDSLILTTPTPADSYWWTGVAGFSATGQTVAIYPVDPTVAGTYFLDLVDTNGCAAPQVSINVNVLNPPAAPMIFVNDPICGDDTINLSTNTPLNTAIEWIAPNGNTVVGVPPLLDVLPNSAYYGSGIWTVIFTDTLTGCQIQADTLIQIDQAPNLAGPITVNDPVCIGDSVQVSVVPIPGVTNYLWFNPDTTIAGTGQTATLPPVLSDTFFGLTVTKVNGCSYLMDTVWVTTYPPIPAPTIMADTLVCFGETIQLSTSPAYGYQWTGPNGFTSTIQNPVIGPVTAADSGSYTLTVLDANNCSSQTRQTIHINAFPATPTATVPAVLCDGDALSLSTTATCDSVYWVSPISNTIIGGTTVVLGANDLGYEAGGWQVFCLDTLSGCATGSLLDTVVINATPTAIAINNGPVCAGDAVVLTAGQVVGATYVWYADSTLLDTVGVGQVVTVNNIQTDSTFYLVVTNVNGCASVWNTTTVAVQPIPPTPNIGPNITVCEGASFQLTTSLAIGYNWSGPNGFTSSQWQPTINNATSANAGIYTLSVVGINGCRSQDTTLSVLVNALPAAPTIAPFVYACQGDTLYLNVDSTANHCDSLVWIGPNGASLPIVGGNITILPTDTNYVSGLWTVFCIDTATGCSTPSNSTLVVIGGIPAVQPISNDGPVCIGGDVTLSTGNAGLFTNYTWYTDSTLTNIAATGQTVTINNITSDTTFYLVLTNSGGCTSSPIPNPVQVLPSTLVPDVPVDTQYCEGDPIQLITSTTANQYLWTAINGFVDTTQNPLVTPAASVLDSGVYSLVVEDSLGCLSRLASFHITVNPLPLSPFLWSNSPVCDGDTLVLNSSTSCTQSLWIGSNGSSNPVIGTGNSIVIPPNGGNYGNSSWYMLCVDSLTGCQAVSDTILVDIISSPTVINVANSGPICSGDSVNLTVSATAGAGIVPVYYWYDDPTFINAIAFGDNVTAHNVTNTTTFYVEVIDPLSGCSLIDSTVVTVAGGGLPPVDSLVLCEGDILTLLPNTNNANSYNWVGPNGFVSNIANPVFPVTVLDSGLYTLNIANNNNCIVTDALIHVTVLPLPVFPLVSNNSPVCLGDTVMLSVLGTQSGVTYDWFILPNNTYVGSGANFMINNATFADTGAYYVTATLNGCLNSSPPTIVTINNSTTTIADAGQDQSLCGQDTITLNGTAFTASEVGLWTSNSTAIIVNPTSSTTLVANLSTGTHVFYWTISNTACSGTSADSVTITVAQPSPDNAIAGTDQVLCGVSTTTLSAVIPVVSAGIWTQSATQVANGVVINNINDPQSSISGLIPGNNYSFVWTLANGACGTHGSDTVDIVVNTAPSITANAGGIVTTCSQDTVLLSAIAPTVGTGLWTTNSGAVIITPNQNTTIVSNLTQDTTMFVWTLSNGSCTNYSTDTAWVIIGGGTPIAQPDNFSLPAGTTTMTIDVINNDQLTTAWDIFINIPMTNGQMVNLNNGAFELDLQGVMTNQSFIYELCNPACPANCDTGLVVIEIPILGACDVPNIFTPNGDGVNDLFIVPCLSVDYTANLIVFNRWGDLVYESDSYQNQWDGTHNGAHLPDGTYFYIMRISATGEELQGSVEIRR